MDRTTRLRLRRHFRRSKNQVEDLGNQAEYHLERNFFKRLSRLSQVRRFVARWLLIFVLLIGAVLWQARSLGSYYLVSKPAPGGLYTEGILGNFTNANPLYAATSVDNSVSRLVFSGLFKFDDHNQLVGDLAESWTTDERGTVYNVKLKPDLKWHDGRPLTTKDVVFTYNMIKNPDAKSVLASSWQGINVIAAADNKVTFTLPNPLSSFPFSLTNGLVPEHILGSTNPSQLRSAPFNAIRPIGSGPFKWDDIDVLGLDADSREQQISLLSNPTYIGGKPKIDHIIIRAFHSQDRMTKSFKDRELDAMSGLGSLPEDVAKEKSVKEYHIPLTSQVMIFLKSSDTILQDQKVRQALAYGTDVPKLLQNTNNHEAILTQPFFKDQTGYDASLNQLTNDPTKAAALLGEAGWTRGAEGNLSKDGKPLSFRLFTQDSSEYNSLAQALKAQWQQLGVNVTIISQQDQDLQATLANHAYEALLYGISLGADSDSFAYWHSSQADLRGTNRLNFSEYKSTAADKALEAGRTRADPAVRTIKYKPFLEAWRQDVPAIALYQPSYLYVVRGYVFGLEPSIINTGADRYNNVHNWMIRVQKQPI